jgi:tRNA threonylcarbamoyladenosine biosynthesis protein TsaE
VIETLTASESDTREMAAQLAGIVRPGDLVLLVGDLGAGKTTFAKGFAAGLGIEGEVTSPTYTLVHLHQGRLPLAHVDVYRLDHLRELVDLGLPELLDDGAVVLVEWGDVLASEVPGGYLEVRMLQGRAEQDRRVQLRSVGAAWCDRAGDVASAVAPWRLGGRTR